MIVVALCVRGLSTAPDQGGTVPFYHYKTITATETGGAIVPDDPAYKVLGQHDVTVKDKVTSYLKLDQNGTVGWWKVTKGTDGITLHETQNVTTTADGTKFINGAPSSKENHLRQVGNLSTIAGEMDVQTGPVNPFKFLSLLGDPGTTVNLWKSIAFKDGTDSVTVYYEVAGARRSGRATRPDVQAGRFGHRPHRLRLAHDRALPRHGFAAAHPHPLLHGAQPESRA